MNKIEPTPVKIDVICDCNDQWMVTVTFESDGKDNPTFRFYAKDEQDAFHVRKQVVENIVPRMKNVVVRGW